MKTRNSKFITASLAAALVVPAFALEAPADDAPPPAQATAAAAAPESAPLPTFKLPADQPTETPDAKTPVAETAFLGVVSAQVPALLAEHLGLANRQGVLVRALCPDSPAKKSGIEVNDVITAVGGTPIASQSDLSREITRSKPGETVVLDVIHKGKSSAVSVVLINKPASLAQTGPTTLDSMNLDSLPKDMADHIRDALGGANLELKLGQGLDADMDLPPEIEDAIGALQKRMLRGGAMLDQVMPPAPDASVQTQSNATFRMMDNDGSIEVTSNNGSKEVTVRDQQDGVVWTGPWNTEAERAAAPDAVRKRMKSLNLDTDTTGGGLKFNFNGNAPDSDH
ncbi:MAG: PDZ domain-containing protein [Verrucomicrobiota bacterium]